MLIIDYDQASRIVAQRIAEERDRTYRKWLEDYERLSKFHDDEEIRPTDAVRQIGEPMAHTEMERRLAKMNPRLRFLWEPFNNHHKMLALDAGDKLEKLFVYPTGSIPERTIWRKKEEYVEDPDYKPSRFDHGAADWEWVPMEGYEHLYRPEGYKLGGWNDPAVLANDPDLPFCGQWQRRDNDAGRAAWKKLNHAWGRHRRGWREVMLMLVQRGLVTVDQVEREFHSDANNPLWKQGLGKGFTTANVV